MQALLYLTFYEESDMKRSIYILILHQCGIYHNMLRRIRPYLLLIATVLLIIFLLQRIHWLPSFSNPFKSSPLIIDNTPVMIKEIHNLSQVISITMYDEVTVDSSKRKHLPSFPGLRPVPDKIVLIGKGKVLAGVNLANMN